MSTDCLMMSSSETGSTGAGPFSAMAAELVKSTDVLGPDFSLDDFSLDDFSFFPFFYRQKNRHKILHSIEYNLYDERK